jgi:hypothetical protein
VNKKIILISRLFLGLNLLATAIGKLLDIQGFAEVIESFQIFSGPITAPMGLALSLFELGLAIWLLSGKNLKLAGLASVLLHSIFVVWLLIAMARGLDIQNCGCYGVFFARPLTIKTIFEDLFMLGVSLTLYFSVKKK